MPGAPAGCLSGMREPRGREREGGRKREGKGRRDGEEGGEEERRNERGHGELMRPRLSPGRGQCESQRSREAWQKVEKAVFKRRDSVGRGTGPEEQMANGWDWSGTCALENILGSLLGPLTPTPGPMGSE